MSNFWKSFLCVFACVFLCVASFFTGYFFRDTVRIKQSEIINSLCAVQPADAVSSDFVFNGSTIPLLVSWYSQKDGSSSSDYVKPTSDLINSSSSVFDGYSPFVFNLGKINSEDNRYLEIYYNFNNEVDMRRQIIVLDSDFRFDTWVSSSLYMPYPYGKYMFYSYYVTSNFNFNVSSVKIRYVTNYLAGGIYATSITYFDNNGYSCEFQFVFDKTKINSSYYLNERTYYFVTDFTDNDYYNQGYQTGFNNGVNSGKQTGYNDGYNVGYSDGKSDGYDEGVNSTTQYSFANLLTAVVEAPVNVFISLLDFNIMGYNLLSLVVGLLSLAIIVVIIKLCLGGK